MKRFISQSALVLALCGGIAFGVFALNEHRVAKDLVVHEWGTFTSIQGSDGVPLYWQSRNVAPLPAFVYDWKKPGLSPGWRQFAGMFGKQVAPMMVQRMETPVVYFYSPHEQTVDVEVEFPKGQMTEWYPRAAEVGPSFSTNSQPRSITKHLLHWPGVQVLANDNAVKLPDDKLGSHYYAARETDSALLRVESATNNGGEVEKFLFYRGVGNFKAPLTASMSDAATVDLENTGQESLRDLFVLDVHQGHARLIHLKTLRPKEHQHVQLAVSAESLSTVGERLSTEMADALVGQKLYPREAAAMVKTWKDSWFEEEGIRVLYLLPRRWTDGILPMTLNPQPHELVRVMVGRAELISPALEKTVAEQMAGVSKDDFASKVQLHQQLAVAGRFANPLLSRTFQVAHKANNSAAAMQPEVWQKVAQLDSAGLIFDAEKKDCSAKKGEEEVHFTFKVANLSAKEVVVERAQGTCGCTYAKLPSQPWHLRSGEVAELPVTMILKGKPPGEISKEVILYTSEGQHKLTVKTTVPAPETVKTAALTQ